MKDPNTGKPREWWDLTSSEQKYLSASPFTPIDKEKHLYTYTKEEGGTWLISQKATKKGSTVT